MCDEAPTRQSNSATPAIVTTNPARINVRCGYLLASRAAASVEKEPEQNAGSGREQHHQQQAVAAWLQDSDDHEEHACRQQDGSDEVKDCVGSGATGYRHRLCSAAHRDNYLFALAANAAACDLTI